MKKKLPVYLQVFIHRLGSLTDCEHWIYSIEIFTRMMITMMMIPSDGLSDILYTFYASVLDRDVPVLKLGFGNFLGVSFRLRIFCV